MCRDRLTVLRPPRLGPDIFKHAQTLITDLIATKTPILPISQTHPNALPKLIPFSKPENKSEF
jgi:hypothetical protein